MKLQNLLAAAALVMTSVTATAGTSGFFAPAKNIIVVSTKDMGSPAKVVLWDGTGDASCGDGFVLGAQSDDFAKNGLTILAAAKAIDVEAHFVYDDVTCEVRTVIMAQPAP